MSSPNSASDDRDTNVRPNPRNWGHACGHLRAQSGTTFRPWVFEPRRGQQLTLPNVPRRQASIPCRFLPSFVDALPQASSP